MRIFLSLLALNLFFGLSAKAAECIKADDIAKIESDFKFVVKKKDLKFDACDDKNRLNQIYASLVALKDYPVQTFVKDKFDANIIAVPPYDFFKQRVRTIIMEQKSDQCDADSQAYVDPDNRSHNQIHICPALMEMDWFTGSAVLLHESRHLDPQHNHFVHVPCEGESLDDAWSCDETYAFGGSYGVETEFFVKAARTTGLHPALRSEAYSTAINNFFVHFKQKPFGTQNGSLIKAADGKLFFYHGEKVEALPVSVSAGDLILGKDGSAVVLNSSDKSVSGLDLRGHDNSPMEMDSAKLRAVLGNDSGEVLDVFMDVEATCVLTARFSRCNIKGKTREHPITNFKPVQYVMPEHSSLVARGALSISADDGYLYQMDGKKSWSRSAKKMNIKNTFGVSRKSDLVIFLNGRTAIYNAKKKTWDYPKELQGISVDKIVAPYVWAKDMKQF